MAIFNDTQMNEETIGQRLRRLREAAGLSKRELAKRSGIDREHIYQIEGGKVKSITLKTAERLAKGLGKPPAVFFGNGHNNNTAETLEQLIAPLLDYIRRLK